MTNQTKHTPGPVQIVPVRGSDGKQWVVGRDNSATQLYYTDSKEAALQTFIKVFGVDEAVSRINTASELLEALKEVYESIDWKFNNRAKLGIRVFDVITKAEEDRA